MNKKMMTGIIYIAIGAILMAIFGAIGNYHIQKARTESAKSNKDEILLNQDSIKNTVLESQSNSKNEIIDSVISNKQEVIANTNELKEGQKNLEKQIKASSKKADINVENSPNTVVQVNENGDNIIDNSTKIYDSQPRILNQKLKDQLLQIFAENSDEVITIVCTMYDPEAYNFASQILTFLESNGFKVNGVDQAHSVPPIIGQYIDKKNLEIRIGSKK